MHKSHKKIGAVKINIIFAPALVKEEWFRRAIIPVINRHSNGNPVKFRSCPRSCKVNTASAGLFRESTETGRFGKEKRRQARKPAKANKPEVYKAYQGRYSYHRVRRYSLKLYKLYKPFIN